MGNPHVYRYELNRADDENWEEESICCYTPLKFDLPQFLPSYKRLVCILSCETTLLLLGNKKIDDDIKSVAM